MIKDLQEKTFKLNVDNNAEKSIIMKRRDVKSKDSNPKIVENQMFDMDGNVLPPSLKNSFTQSFAGSINSRVGDYTQSVMGNH